VYTAEDRQKLMAAMQADVDQRSKLTGSDELAGKVVSTNVPPPDAALPAAVSPMASPMMDGMASPMVGPPIGSPAAEPAYTRERLDIGPPVAGFGATPPAPENSSADLPPVNWLGPFGGLVDGTKLARPSYLDGTLAADAGFDPLGFCVNGLPNGMASSFSTPNPSPERLRSNLVWMREAEVKHARLAMLAAAGWPLAELWHGPLARLSGLPFALDATQGRSPSLLNGHLLDSWPFLAVATLAVVAVEVSTLDQVYGMTRTGVTMSASGRGAVQLSYVPGDLGFDPLGLYSSLGNSVPAMTELKMKADPTMKIDWDAYHRKEMEASEIYHGRAAMLGITGFAVQEFVTGVPVVDQTPAFFTPFWEQLAPGAVASLGVFPQF